MKMLRVQVCFSKTGSMDRGLHLRSNFTENLTSHLSLTRSYNFLNIDLKAVTGERYTVIEGRVDPSSYEANFAHYEIKINAPVYTLREDVTYRLNPQLQLESGFLYAFNPAKSSENGWLEENFEPASDLGYTVETPDGEVVEESPFEEVHDEFGHDFYRTEGYVQGRYDPLSFLSVALGVRLDYLNVTEQVSVQPRGSVSFTLTNGSNLRFAYGHYEQSPQPSHLLAENGNRALASSLTRHYIMELEHALSSRTELKLATYYKGRTEVGNTR